METERPSLEVRRANFAAFVKRVVDNAAQPPRSWDRTRVIKETGIGRTTFYRWLNGDWTEDPEAAKVRDFCDALDVPPAIAFGILWPGKRDRAPKTEPGPMDPDVQVVLRKLMDPNVSDDEKWFLRESIRALATRPGRSRQAG